MGRSLSLNQPGFCKREDNYLELEHLSKDVQERCRQEVVEVLGDEKAAVADMPKMPYVLATIAEVDLDN